jgi:NAD+ kinase
VNGPRTTITPPHRVGLVVHGGRADARTAAATAAAAAHDRGLEVIAFAGDEWADEAAGLPVTFQDAEAFGNDVDLILVLGGDGTFLRAAHLTRDCGAPLLGVNLGRLGFLSEIEMGELDRALDHIVAGTYSVEERMTLQAAVHTADGSVIGHSWALNEASVERVIPQRLIVLEVRVGETLFANVPADAIILATPTGSTAYAFSAGGPIMSPLVDAILLVAVAPHTLFDRTLVVDPTESLSVRPIGGDNPCIVSLDGRETMEVPVGGCVRVSRGEAPVRMVRLRPFDFYALVRSKFGLR